MIQFKWNVQIHTFIASSQWSRTQKFLSQESYSHWIIMRLFLCVIPFIRSFLAFAFPSHRPAPFHSAVYITSYERYGRCTGILATYLTALSFTHIVVLSRMKHAALSSRSFGHARFSAVISRENCRKQNETIFGKTTTLHTHFT